MKVTPVLSRISMAIIAVTILACVAPTESETSSDITLSRESTLKVSVSPNPTPFEQPAENTNNSSEPTQPGSQPTWNNENHEGQGAEDLLVTLKSSRARLDTGETANLKASANNRCRMYFYAS